MTRTLGWVYPDVVDRVHVDFFHMTPPDVNLIIATRLWSLSMMHAGHFDRGAFRKLRDEIIEAASELGGYQQGVVDYVIVSGDLIQAAMGPRWDRELATALADTAGKPATTAMTALVDALTALEVGKVAIVTPFRDEQNEHLRSYLTCAGFDVTAVRGVQTNTTQDIRELPPDCAYDLAIRAVESDDRTEGLYVSCPVWSGVSESIARLERELNLPVVTTFSAILWRALSALSHGWHGGSYGTLLASLGSQTTTSKPGPR
jgi:maleate cis-trans isomerase